MEGNKDTYDTHTYIIIKLCHTQLIHYYIAIYYR